MAWAVERLNPDGKHHDWLADPSGRTVVIGKEYAEPFPTYDDAETAMRKLQDYDSTGCTYRITAIETT